VLYAGPAPFSVVGFYQVNIRIPVIPKFGSGQLQLKVLLNPPGGPVASSSDPVIIDIVRAP
jgi:hypothetical protein